MGAPNFCRSLPAGDDCTPKKCIHCGGVLGQGITRHAERTQFTTPERWRKGSTRAKATGNRNSSLYLQHTTVLAQLHLKPDSHEKENCRSQRCPECSFDSRYLRNANQYCNQTSCCSTDVLTSRVQETWNIWKKNVTGLVVWWGFFGCNCFTRKQLPVCFNVSYLNFMGRNVVLSRSPVKYSYVYDMYITCTHIFMIYTQIHVSTDTGKPGQIW